MTGEANDVTGQTEGARAPVLKVVNPDATPEEIAALVAVFSAMGGGEAPSRKPRSRWSDPVRTARRPLHPGLGGWRASGLPRP